MAKSERNIYLQASEKDLGRARRRKLQREGGGNMRQEKPRDVRKNSQVRTARRSGPTMRERLVADQIKTQSEGLTSIQEKLASQLGLGTLRPKTNSTSKRVRRDTEPRHSESLFEATQRVETQRITGSEKGYIPHKSSRIYDAHSEANPPVMVRGGMGGMAFGRVAASRLPKQRVPKRRIDVPLRSTGAELRLPSIPLLNLGWRSISLLMVILMSAMLVLMWQAPVFKVGTVQAQGLKRLTVNDLSAVMGTFGKSIFSLNPHILRDELSAAFPEFSKISVRINLPASVKVVVTERQPLIAWTQDGIDSWVDADGISFPVRGELDTPLVRVEGYGTPPGMSTASTADGQTGTATSTPLPRTPNNPSLRLSPELISAILALGAKMPPDTVLVYDSQHGLGWNDPHGWDVFFGDESQDMEMKLAVYQALVDRLTSEGIQPALISVEYIHAPYYRMER